MRDRVTAVLRRIVATFGAFTPGQQQARRELDEFVDAQLMAEPSQRRPGGLARQPGDRKCLSQSHERPPATDADGLVQGALDACATGEVDANEFEERAEGVSEATSLLNGLAPNQQIGKEEPTDSKDERDPDGNDYWELQACHTRGGDASRNDQQPEHRKEHLVEVEAFERLPDHGQVGSG